MTTKHKVKRPFLLYLLPILFLLTGAISLVGTLGIFQAWEWWLTFTSVELVIIRVFLGVLSALAWVSAAIILWRRLSWAIIYCSLVTLLAAIWFWVERLFITQNPLPFNRHLLAIAVTCVLLIFVLSALYLVAPFMKLYQSSQKDGGSTLIQPTGEKK